jgi:hypothetical protein
MNTIKHECQNVDDTGILYCAGYISKGAHIDWYACEKLDTEKSIMVSYCPFCGIKLEENIIKVMDTPELYTTERE